MTPQNKLEEAYKIVQKFAEEYEKSSWVYQDFATDDERFKDEIKQSIAKGEISEDLSAEDLADFAINKIETNARRGNLLGF